MLRSYLLDGMGYRRNSLHSNKTIGSLMIDLVSSIPFIPLIYRDTNAKSIVVTMNQNVLPEQTIVHIHINEGYKLYMMYWHKLNRLFCMYFQTEYVGSGVSRISHFGPQSAAE